MIGLLFPGQGSQGVGMGAELAEASEIARETFELADEALGESLSTLCWKGPEEKLQLTENTQPAILTVSIAAYRELEQRGLAPDAVAGHSLGEYSALVAAGALDFADAVRLVRKRGQAMQRAVPVGEGAMAAILGLDDDVAVAVVSDAAAELDAVCTVANFNSPGQVVIAGEAGAVARAGELAVERGARKALPLPVSAPFHCPLMAPAREEMTPLIEAADVRDPRFPVVCNVDAEAVTGSDAVRSALIRQIDAPVRWTTSMGVMLSELGIQSFYEVGPGRVLTGLMRRIERSAECRAVSTPEEIDAVFESLEGG